MSLGIGEQNFFRKIEREVIFHFAALIFPRTFLSLTSLEKILSKIFHSLVFDDDDDYKSKKLIFGTHETSNVIKLINLLLERDTKTINSNVCMVR